MPHINRIRVNNVKYNFGTQFYDDFMMRFSGKNTIYDLANGGGKSVLMLLLMQNLIPNCTLDDKQPIEKLFRTGEGSTVIHSMIEWILSDAHIKDNFKYMLTGFCARKAKDNGEEVQKNTAEIEYFNYVIFYRKYNEHDIKNIPLQKDGERITYTGLKNYIKDLEHSDHNLDVHIFERKGDYQRFIAEYGLYESHWEIIRGINKTEGHVRTYFESNYKTTRKVVEDLLIEEIIQKSFQNRYNNRNEEDVMAKTLLDIKDKLLELSGRKEEIHNYDRQMELLDNFSDRIKGIRQLYVGMDALENELATAYNTIVKAQDGNRQARIIKADKKLETLKLKNDLSRRVETAKVMDKAAGVKVLESELEELKDSINTRKEQIDTLSNELVMKECTNDFLDYITYKNEYDKIKESLDNATKDTDSLVVELHNLVKTKKSVDDMRIDRIDKEVQEETAVSEKERAAISGNKAAIKELEKQIAVYEFNISEYEGKNDAALKKLEPAKNDAGILVPSEAAGKSKEAKRQLEQISLQIEEAAKELSDIKAARNDYAYEKQKYLQGENAVEAELSWNEERLKEFRALEEKADSVCKVYDEKNILLLQRKIKESLHEKMYDTEVKSKEYSRMLKEVEARKNGKAFVESDVVVSILDYIERYHGDKAVSGLEYIRLLDSDRREEVLWRIPVLPYGIVVKKDFDEITSDTRINELRKSHEPVVFIRESAITKDEVVSDADNVFYLMDKDDVMRTPEQWQSQVESMDRACKDKESELARLKEMLLVMEEDYQFVTTFIKEKQQARERAELIEELKLKHKQAVNDREAYEEKLLQWEQSFEKISSDVAVLEEKRNECEAKIQVYGLVDDIYTEITQNERILSENRDELNKCKKELDTLVLRVQAEENRLDNRQIKINALLQEKASIQKEWDEKYALYNAPDGKIIDDISYEELNIKLQGIFHAVTKQNANLEDRQKLMMNYKSSMDKTMKRISYQGISGDSLMEKYRKHELYETPSDKLEELKNNINSIKSSLEQKQQEEKKLMSRVNKLEGNITNAIQVISEKYGFYEEESLEGVDVKAFISDNGAILQQYEADIVKVDKELKEIDEAVNEYEILMNSIKNRIEMEGITIRNTEETYDSGIDIREKCSEILKKYEKFRSDVSKRRDDFVREKQMLTDTMKMVSGEALAEEISNSVNMPATFDEAGRLVEMLEETVSCLKLEKERVGKGIEDMEMIKENFESQCLQNCLNIKTELERLSKLSRIVMDGETISIINLKIPYKKEETYKSEMSDYIDMIAENTDNLSTEEERIKYIRNQLNWKKLFSVIVTDMNSIKLNLYKRERIKEQSRYLPYEEAVGSTGQSQGIYIQFLIAIINYISSINSKNADAAKLRKVVFLDNPFGAAKDTYIWEPIFKLLKTNNVQLIVPARGATPAITGRFDVNYVLGQKMVGKRQQTVVVDYFSNVENEEIEYTTIDYKQTSLF